MMFPCVFKLNLTMSSVGKSEFKPTFLYTIFLLQFTFKVNHNSYNKPDLTKKCNLYKKYVININNYKKMKMVLVNYLL